MATDAISQEQAMTNYQEAEDRALMAGADIEDISNIRTKIGLPAAQEVPTTVIGFKEDMQGFAPSEEKEQPSFQWKKAAAWEHVNKLKIAANLPEEEVIEIYNDLVVNGHSEKANKLWQTLEREDKQTRLEGIASAVPEIGVDAAAIQAQNLLSTTNDYLVDDAALAAVVANSSDPTTIMDRWQKEIDTRDQFKREFAEAMKYVPFSEEPAAPFIESMLPFVHQSDAIQLGEMLKEKFKDAPVGSKARGLLLEGNYLADIRDWITELPAEEQLNVFRYLVEATDEVSGALTDNDLLKKDMLRQLFAGATGDYVEGDIDVDKYINNAVSLLDATLVGSIAKGAVSKIIGSTRRSSLETAKRVDPKKGQEATATVIADPTQNTAEALGTTREDVVVDSLLPKWQGYAEDPMVSASFVERQVKLLTEVKNRTTNLGDHLKDTEKQAQTNAIVEALEKASPLNLEMNRSTSFSTDVGSEVEAVYTVSNAAQAERDIKRLYPDAIITRENESTLRVNIKQDYRADNNVVFDIDDIFGRGNKAKYLMDISSNLAKNLSDSFYVAFDTSKANQHLFLEMIEPFTKAKNTNKGYIVDILDKTRKYEQEVTIDQLRDMLPKGVSQKDAKEILEGVLSVRTMTDAAYVVENKVFRDRQIALGRQYVKLGDFEAMATPASLERATQMRVAYDPATGNIRNLTPETVKQIYEEGGQIAVSGATHGADEAVQTRNIIVTADTEINTLPQQVLKYDANYLTTLYKDQYFITQKKKKLTLDGEVVPEHALPVKVLSTAKSRKEAEAAVAQLKAANPDVEYAFKNARELTAPETQEAYENLRRSTGGLFFSKKGERLKDTVGGLAEIEDPVTSIQLQAALVGRMTSLRPIADLMKSRFVNTFPQFSEKGFPLSKANIRNPSLVKDEAAETAKVMWDYINMLENGSAMGQKWQNAMIGFGEWLEDVTGSAKLGSFARTSLGAKDPMSAARGATFLSTIVLNPARQLLIQSQQYLFLTGIDPVYVMSGQAQRRGGALLFSSLGDKRISDKAAARLAGMPVGEYKQAVAAFKESGLTEAIDSHLLGRDALLEISNEITKTRASKLGQVARNVVTSTINAAKSVGFDLGERINISNTYMLAWKRYRDKFPDADMSSSKAKTAVAADARQLALGMTQVGGFGYQDGWLSMATQFFSVQHKAALAMMRGIPGLSKYGNKAIEPKEARRIMAFQTAIYGAAGMGINGALDWALDEADVGDLDPQTRQLLHGGAFDMMMNTAISSLSGEETNISFAKEMSAGQGFAPNLLQYIEDIASGDVGVLELMAGAAGTVGSRFGTALSTLTTILGSPAQLTPERANLLLNDFGSIASGYRQFLNAKAMTNLGVWVDKNRNLMPIPVNKTEAFVHGLVGMGPEEVEAFYHTVQTAKDSKQRLDDIATVAFGRITRIIADTAKESNRGFHYLEAQKELYANEAYVLQAILGEKSADYYAVMSRVQDLLKQRINGQESWLDMLHKGVMNNTYGGDLPSLYNYLGRNTNLDQKQLDNIRTVYEKAINVGGQ